MNKLASLFPDRRTLRTRLAAALDGDDPSGSSVTIVARRPPRLMSTFPGEVVTFRLRQRRSRRVFIKYEAGQSHNAFGHRGGIAYEAAVYRQVLSSLPRFLPRCLGASTERQADDAWLMLEYLGRCARVCEVAIDQTSRQPRVMVQLARWLGKFHAVHEAPVAQGAFPFLKRYDARFYRGWPRRTADFARPLRKRFPWLAGLCRRIEEWSAPLLAARPTVIHGEFYTKNVLLRRQKAIPVDWESAAIAAGEIDLAALTEGTGWTDKLVQRCVREYQRARWPEGVPADFQRTFDAARIYLHFRWLGERPDKTTRRKTFWRYEHLHAAAKRMGML